MTGRITTCDHAVYDLPQLLSWNVCYTGAVPCDNFMVTCLFLAEVEPVLRRAESMTLMDGENVLLRGVVDEYEIRQTTDGISALIAGRGYAARLLDNESQSMTYQNATLHEIIQNHVAPYGIVCDKIANIRSNQNLYTVSAGSSQWKALVGFCNAYGNFTPTFDRYGRLWAASSQEGKLFEITDQTKILSLIKREDHYGVLSEVLVVDKTRGQMYSVKNHDFIKQGGQCRRVMYTPGQSSWAAMRYTGEYQIQQSQKDEAQIELTLEGGFLAFPGDRVFLTLKRLGLSGTFCVAEAETHADDKGETITLILKETNK